MFKRISLMMAAIALACLSFVACDKKADQAAAPAAAPAAQEAAPAADAAAPAAPEAAPDGQVPPPGAPMPPPGAHIPPPPGGFPPPHSLPPVPPEAQAAVDALIEVMGVIAAAGQKDTCAEVLSELKKIQADENIKTKLLSTKVLSTYSEDIQRSINESNQQRLLGLAFQMQAFNKCQKEPESADIDAVVKAILEPIVPEESEAAPAPAAAAPEAAPAPAAVAPEAVPAPAAAAPEAAPAPAAAAPEAAPAPAAAAPEAAPAPVAAAPAP